MLRIVQSLLSAYTWLIIVRVFLPLFGMGPHSNALARLVFQATDPIVAPLERVMPKVRLGNAFVDFSPIVAVLLMDYVVTPLILSLLGMLI